VHVCICVCGCVCVCVGVGVCGDVCQYVRWGVQWCVCVCLGSVCGFPQSNGARVPTLHSNVGSGEL
jgi:hypothetical protein